MNAHPKLSPPWYTLVLASLLFFGLACTYDFDSPFPTSPSTAASGQGGAPFDAGIGDSAQAGSSQAGSAASCTWHVPAPPSGWRIGFTLPPDDPSSQHYVCSGMTRSFEHEGISLYVSPPVVADSTCECVCGPPQGGSCTVTKTKIYKNSSCSNKWFSVPADECGVLLTIEDPTSTYARLETNKVTAPTCSPGTLQLVPGPVTWPSPLTGCVVPQTVQQDNDPLCLASETLPPNAIACVISETAQPCPPDYPLESPPLYDGSLNDTRTCPQDSCACDPGDTPHCETTLTAYDGPFCSTKTQATTSMTVRDGTCLSTAPLDGFPIASMVTDENAHLVGATCQPAPSQTLPTVVGTVTPARQLTVCCQAE